MAFNQDDRLLRMTKGPLGKSEVLMTSFSGHEAISRLFSFQMEFLSTKLELKATDLVGKDVTIEIDRRDAKGDALDPRHFHGYISRFTAGDVTLHETGDFKYRSYRAEMVPWLWFLTQTARCFIFFPEKEEKTVYEIIEDVFKRAKDELHVKAPHDLKGIAELKNRKLKHCVQYRETDFNFISRILEQFGAYFYFTHKDSEDKLFVSMTKNYPKCKEAKVSFEAYTGGQSQTDHIGSWEHAYEFVSGKWEHKDYNFTTPSASLDSNSTKISVKLSESDKYEVYDYPGEFEDSSAADKEARIRQEEEEVPHDVAQASSTCRTFLPGHKFTLTGHPDEAAAKEKNDYLITSIQHHAEQPPPETGQGGVADYSNSFSCVPATIQFRPARITPKPVVSGIQTAVVVGPKGEEIHTDKYGRIKVHFHWDREENRKRSDGDKFFCWVRTAHNIAGKEWGFMAIPRIGQEVVVDFLEGDPDRPLVVGSVYNADQMPHYPLPAEKTKSYIKTNSTKGGDGFNELCFEDKKDEERVFIHAQKNMDTRVRNDSKSRIYGHRHQIIGWEKDGDKGGDQREMVWQDKHQNIKRNQSEYIEGNMELMVGKGEADDGGNLDIVIEKDRKELIEENSHLHVKQDRYKTIDGNQTLTLAGDQLEDISGNQHRKIAEDHNEEVVKNQSLKVGADRKEEVGGTMSLTIAGDQQEKVGKNHALEAGQEIHFKAGMKIIIEAGMQLSLIGPGGFIDIGPAGVTIQGTMVKINSGGAAGSGSGSSPVAPDPPEKPPETQDAKEAEPTKPSQAHNSTTGKKSAPD